MNKFLKMYNTFQEDKIEAEEEIRLYMFILEQLGRYQLLLKLVQGDFGEKLKCVLNEKHEKEIEYLIQVGYFKIFSMCSPNLIWDQ